MGSGRPARPRLLAFCVVAAVVVFVGDGLSGFVGGFGGATGCGRRRAAPRLGEVLPRGSRTTVAVAAGVQEAAKARLLDLLDKKDLSTEVQTTAGKPAKGFVDEAIISLERANKCIQPVYSKMLSGSWRVKYSGTYAPGLLPLPNKELAYFLYGSFSLGNALASFVSGFWGRTLGLKLGRKVIDIVAARDIHASVEVEFLGSKTKLGYTAELMPLSSQRMSEEIVSLTMPGPIGKRELPFQLRRNILVTYLDDEVMVVRDESGVPDVWVRSIPGAEDEEEDIFDDGPYAFDHEQGEDPLSSGAA